MLCTNCSSPVRPIVTFDVDGTMGLYHEHFLNFAATYLGYSPLAQGKLDYDGAEPFRTWTCARFDIDTRTFRDIKLAYRQGAQKRSMPVQRWARVATRLAHDAGAEVWTTTTRPWQRLDNVDPDTQFWLKRHGIYFDHLIYGDHKYEDLSRQIEPERVCFVLDDLAEQIDLATRVFHRDACYMYGTQWNAHYRGQYPFLFDGQAVIETMTRRINSWTTVHS